MAFHFDPRLTWGHIAATASALVIVGVMWQQVDSAVDAINSLTQSIETNNARIGQIEARTAVLESQRIEDTKRLDEIRDDVRVIRAAVTGQ